MATSKVRKNIYLSQELTEKAEHEAEKLGISFGSYVAIAIEHYLAHKGRALFELLANHEENK